MLETLWSQRDSNVFKVAVLTVAEGKHFTLLFMNHLFCTPRNLWIVPRIATISVSLFLLFLSFQQKFENTADYLTISANGIATKHTKA